MQFVPNMSRFGLELFHEKLHDDNGFINLNREIDTPTGMRPGYLSVSMIRQAAARIPQIGLVPVEALDEEREANADLRQTLDGALRQLEDAEAQLGRVNGIAREGFKVVRATGAAAHKSKVVSR